MNRTWIALASSLVVIAIGAYILWPRSTPTPPEPAAPIAAPTMVAPAEPAIRHPVPDSTAELPPLEKSDAFIRERLIALLGEKTVVAALQPEQFVRRVVATVDSLARPLAPPRMWPIHATAGRFTVDDAGGGKVIGAKNTARYAPFVELVDAVDLERAVTLYRLLYPLFQRAYESLGYPGKYFNDRLVAVIDLLLATPEPAGPLKVELPQIEGPLKPSRPWVLYRYVDPELEKLSSGQKILLRVGLENEKRLKAKFVEIRKRIAAEKAGR